MSAIVDLVTTACAGGGNEDFSVEFFQMRKENERADLHRDFVVFLFVAKRTCHTATAGRDFLHSVIFR